MSKNAQECSISINRGTDRHEDVAARLRAMSAINEVLVHSVVGDDAGNWNRDALDGMLENQRLHIVALKAEVEAMRLEFLALTRREAA